MKWANGTYKTKCGVEVEITSVDYEKGLQGYTEAEWGNKKIKLHHSWDITGICIDDSDLDLIELLRSDRYDRSLE